MSIYLRFVGLVIGVAVALLVGSWSAAQVLGNHREASSMAPAFAACIFVVGAGAIAWFIANWRPAVARVVGWALAALAWTTALFAGMEGSNLSPDTVSFALATVIVGVAYATGFHPEAAKVEAREARHEIERTLTAVLQRQSSLRPDSEIDAR